MGDIVNLRGERKQRTRALADAKAAGNRISYGVAKSARMKAEAERQLGDGRLDGHRRPERGDGD